MAAWHRARRADIGLRALGSGMCGLAGLAAQRLLGLSVPPHPPGLPAVALATLAFLGASAGSALLLLGAHLFDRIEVSARWRREARVGNAPGLAPGATDLTPNVRTRKPAPEA